MVTHWLSSHLHHKHKILKDSVLLGVLLKEAKPYLGLQELDVVVPPKRRRIAQVEKVVVEEEQVEVEVEEDAEEEEEGKDEAEVEEEGEAYRPEEEEEEEEGEAYRPEEEEDEEEEEPLTLKGYFTIKNPKTERHQWLTSFWWYLGSPDAGNLKDQDRKQHASQVRALFTILDKEGQGIGCLVEEGGQAVWNRYVQPLLDDELAACGTIKSYLGSLEKFVEFLTIEPFKRQDMPTIAQDHETILRYLRNILKGWRSTVEKRTQHQKWEKYIQECDKLLLPEDVRQVMSSSPALEGLKAFTSAKAGVPLTTSAFTAARDLILASLSLQNGSRPGPLNNAKLQNYHQAWKEEKTGKLVMLVARHKRAQQGPAMLCMDDRLQDWLATYVAIIRPQFALPEEDVLFVKTTGEAFPEATIGKRIIAFYKKVGIRKDISVSSTKIRKMIATSVHTNDPDVAAPVRKLMAHSQKTVELSYVRSTLTTTASTAHDIVQRNIQLDSPCKTPTTTSKQQEAVVTTQHSTPDKQTPLTVTTMQSPSGSTCSRGLTSEEKDDIAVLFADEISRNTTPDLAAVRSKMNCSNALAHLLPLPKMVKRVADRVRYLQRQGEFLRPQEPPQSKDEQVQQWLASEMDTMSTTFQSLSCTSSRRSKWSEEDTSTIISGFSKYVRRPSKKEIETEFKENQVLRTIREREGFPRCYEKVKALLKASRLLEKMH